MATMYDVNPTELIEKTAEELKKAQLIKPPVWATFVKTGMHKERPPIKDDWWYVRSASVLRTVAKLGPIGVSKLRTKYGGKKNRGMQAEATYKGSGSIIRKILQQLEKSGYLKQVDKKGHKGRIITPLGLKLLNKVASDIDKTLPRKEEVKTEIKEEIKAEPKKEQGEKKTATKKETKKKESKKENKEDKKEADKTEQKEDKKEASQNG